MGAFRRRGAPRQAGHGHARIEWLERLEARPRPPERGRTRGFERWHGRGATAISSSHESCARSSQRRRSTRALVVCERTFPTGMLGYWVRRLAEGGLVARADRDLAARLAPPDGAEAGRHEAARDRDPELGAASRSSSTSRWARSRRATSSPGSRRPEELVPFGGEQAHKAFALALGLQLFVDALCAEAVRRSATRCAPRGRSGAGAARARGRRAAARRPSTLAGKRGLVPDRGEVGVAPGVVAHFGSSATAALQTQPRRAGGRAALHAAQVVEQRGSPRAARRAPPCSAIASSHRLRMSVRHRREHRTPTPRSRESALRLPADRETAASSSAPPRRGLQADRGRRRAGPAPSSWSSVDRSAPGHAATR